MTEQEYDTTNTEWPVCPWCGHGSGPCEIHGRNTQGNTRCGRCRRWFSIRVKHPALTYTTCKLGADETGDRR